MNTPPPENESPKLDLVPSFSMPAQMVSSTSTTFKRRRHTLTRPDGAFALLSDHSDEGETEDQALDRITDILSNLIQEANDAVQNHGYTSPTPSASTISRRPQSAFLQALPQSARTTNGTHTRPRSILTTSRLPRPKAQPPLNQQYNHYWVHDRHSSISSIASSGTLFSPAPMLESPSTVPSMYHQQQQDQKDDCCHPLEWADSELDDNDALDPSFEHPLMASFRRLDSSMALVDSLSRDLAHQEEQHEHSIASITPLLLLLPLFHIPHALITAVVDTLTSPGTTNTATTTAAWKSSSSSPTPSPSLSGMIAWTIFFALANIVITWPGVTERRQTHNGLLPGSYDNDSDRRIRSRPAPINTALGIKKSSSLFAIRQTPIQPPLAMTISRSNGMDVMMEEDSIEHRPIRRYSL